MNMLEQRHKIAQMVNAVHLRICDMFPAFIHNGWRYRGFEPDQVGGVGVVVILRFEKSIKGRTAFVEVQISEVSFNNPDFDMKRYVDEALREQEVLLVIEREAQLDLNLPSVTPQ